MVPTVVLLSEMMLKLLAVAASGMVVGSSTSAMYSLLSSGLPVLVGGDRSFGLARLAAQAPRMPIAEMDTALTAAPFSRFLRVISAMVPPLVFPTGAPCACLISILYII